MALPERLGREERIERLGDDVGRHARPGIGDADREVLPGIEVALARAAFVEPLVGRLDGDASAVRHRVARIDAQVQERALELGRVDQRGPQPAGGDDLERDLRADRAPDQFLHADHQPVHVGRLGVEGLPAREGEQAMGEGGGAAGRGLRGVEIAVDVGEAALAQPGLEQLHRAHDAGQQIVEVVRQAAGELADRLHLLRLPQRLLGLAQPLLRAQAVGDVVGELVGADAPSLGIAQRVNCIS